VISDIALPNNWRYADLDGEPLYSAEEMAQMAARDRERDALWYARPKRERPKVPTICTRPLSVAQVLADTANPARTLGVL
jgi:hypothetical protein